jgi:hypothetical protein
MSVYAGPTNTWLNLTNINALNGLVTSNLELALDPARTISYPGTGTTVYDLSGNLNTSTLTNGTIFVNNTFSTDGIDDCITVPTFNFQRDFTISCWVNPTALSSPAFYMLGNGTNNTAQGLHIFLTSTSVNYRMYGGDLNTSQTFSTNTWYNLAFTYLNSSPYTKNIYLNGSFLSTGSGLQYTGTGNFRIGALYSSIGTEFGKGNFGLVTVHSRVLTAAEIQQNFNALRRRFGI